MWMWVLGVVVVLTLLGLIALARSGQVSENERQAGRPQE